jgi:predicted Zn-dependent protease
MAAAAVAERRRSRSIQRTAGILSGSGFAASAAPATQTTRRRGMNAAAHPLRRRGGIRVWPLLLFGLYFVYYFFSNQQDAAFTGRTQLIDTSAEQEAALGFQSYQEILSQSNVVEHGETVEQVRAITRRLVDAAPKVEQYLAETKNVPKTTAWDTFEWEVSLIDDASQVNAFCLPGGKMAVYTGILPVAKTADGLAAVMGHEIAHALLRHGGERMAQQKLVQIGAIAANVAVGEMDIHKQRMIMAAIGAGAQYGVLLPFSREHENEADYLGLLIAGAACFDPTEAPRLWERMGEASRGAPPEFMSTHPSHATRIRRLTELQGDAQAIRARFCPPQ